MIKYKSLSYKYLVLMIEVIVDRQLVLVIEVICVKVGDIKELKIERERERESRKKKRNKEYG